MPSPVAISKRDLCTLRSTVIPRTPTFAGQARNLAIRSGAAETASGRSVCGHYGLLGGSTPIACIACLTTI
jgi:hypothetical protein